MWAGNRDALGADAARPETVEQFRASYPVHPHVLETLTGKTATLANFQRVRRMLRLLAHTVKHRWRQRPAHAMAIHLHHVDPGYEPIRQEIVTRLGQDAFVTAITNDVAAGSAEQPVAGRGHRRTAASGAAALRGLRRADDLHAHAGVQ